MKLNQKQTDAFKLYVATLETCSKICADFLKCNDQCKDICDESAMRCYDAIEACKGCIEHCKEYLKNCSDKEIRAKIETCIKKNEECIKICTQCTQQATKKDGYRFCGESCQDVPRACNEASMAIKSCLISCT